MTFSCSGDDVDRAVARCRRAAEIGFREIVSDRDVAKVSVVGIGMRSHAGVAQKMFAALAAEGVNIKVITTSEIKVSVLIDRKYLNSPCGRARRLRVARS
jgi:aspartate kinase